MYNWVLNYIKKMGHANKMFRRLKKLFRLLANKEILRIFASAMMQWGISSSSARALDWQSKGDEFESRMLHLRFINFKRLCKSFFLLCSLICFFIYLCGSKYNEVNYVDI